MLPEICSLHLRWQQGIRCGKALLTARDKNLHLRKRKTQFEKISLFLSSLLLDVANSSIKRGSRLIFTRPVILGLGHPVSSVGGIVPAILKVGSTFEVKLSVVQELSGLGHIPLVVGIFLGSRISTDLLLLCVSKAQWNVGSVGELASLEVLLWAGSVLIGVSDGCPEI